MRAEVEGRGFNYENAGVIERWLNLAYRQICSRKPWPFLEAEVEGEAPLSLPEARHVMSVSDVQNETLVRGVTRQYILERSPTLNSTGVPIFWYMENNTTLVTFPPNEDTIRVRYEKRPAPLEGTETPLVPDPWQYLIVDLAVTFGLKSNDEYEEARGLKQDVEAGIREMIHDLMGANYQRNQTITRTGLPTDYSVWSGW